MIFMRTRRKRLFFALIGCFFIICLIYVGWIYMLPSEITLLEGDENPFDFKSPFFMNINIDMEETVNFGEEDIKVSSSYLRFSEEVSMKPVKNGHVSLDLKLFGLIPVKTVKIAVVPNREIAACGNTVGVKIKLDGILVIGMSDVETTDGRRLLPASEAGIKPGDLIIEANDKKLEGIDDLIEVVDNSKGERIKIGFKSGNNFYHAYVKPEKAADDKKYHIGLWVRDSTAGIGTLTFYDPVTKSFGALGHGITDIDTGTLMPIKSGEILGSSILGIKKGKNGVPGELKGVFIEDGTRLGVININSHYGIYGKLNEEAEDRLVWRMFPIGLRHQVREGPAKILSNINGQTVEEFEVEIQKVSRQNLNGTKGMVIKITDKKLIEATGGIVQGMSGSPIIQDNRLIGAVTHVLVNDPTRGYGIFIEGMLKNIAGGKTEGLLKAS